MKQTILFLFFLLFSVGAINAQTLSDLQKQRKKTEESIALTNKMLKKNNQSKNQELSNIKLLSRKISYREKLITDIDNEIRELERIIAEKETTIASYSTDLEKMKTDYAELLKYIWTRRSTYNQLMYVLAGQDITQIYRRFRYLQEFSSHQKAQATAIQELSNRLIIEKDSLQIQKEEQNQLLAEYSSETKKLQGEQKNKKKQIASLRKNEKKLKRKLKQQQQKRDELKKFVDKLIAEETRIAKKNNKGKLQLTPEQQLTSDKFAGNKGKLPWPVISGIIDEPYGKHTHEVFSRVEVENDGIDIRTDAGSDVRTVFDGEVKCVVAIPGYNKGVIVQHGEYFSFYVNLSEVYVKKGDRVNTKQKLGKIYIDKDKKSIFHFEIWKNKSKQNPQLWLCK